MNTALMFEAFFTPLRNYLKFRNFKITSISKYNAAVFHGSVLAQSQALIDEKTANRFGIAFRPDMSGEINTNFTFCVNYPELLIKPTGAVRKRIVRHFRNIGYEVVCIRSATGVKIL